jgi:hypothetical protein
MHDEDTFRSSCNDVMQTIADDISGDHPGADVDYEVYLVEVDGTTWGFGYMGDMGEWLLAPGPDGPETAEIACDYATQERAKALTPYGKW